jgi:hypothetical protein
MPIFRERLTAAPWLFIATALVIPATLLVFLPISTTVGIVAAIVLYAACVVALIVGSPVLVVDGSGLSAGRARLPLHAIGEVSAFRGTEAVAERGVRLDARAWLLIRGWIAPVVKVAVADAADPAPYWLLSTRNPEAVVDAITKARSVITG